MTLPVWKVVHASVRGTSHIATGAPCQDRHAIASEKTPHGEYLVAICADGAGSARLAEVGAEAACMATLSAISADLQAGFSPADEERVRVWVAAGRDAISGEAERLEADLRDMACTLVGAVIGESTAVFFQIGDGAIVASVGSCYGVVFWPQGGEFAGTTFFLTDELWSDRLQVTLASMAVNELALFTDGLERLILRFADQTVHLPSLLPMWNAARAAADGQELNEALAAFLESEAVVNRTDDDKSLIIATRRLPVTIAPVVEEASAVESASENGVIHTELPSRGRFRWRRILSMFVRKSDVTDPAGQ